MQFANSPDHSERGAKRRMSLRHCGKMAVNLPIIIPRLPNLAKQHRA